MLVAKKKKVNNKTTEKKINKTNRLHRNEQSMENVNNYS